MAIISHENCCLSEVNTITDINITG